ncbi:MAG: arginine N-succinyltransferase [Gammaproteobacteria bacterium CG22_combo_CG10-13_8_21_14_all_40_8]|nr:MAG: arginine N-succinyltransferase [Gammaproteobacteria bacterium CG22_combo_CG10-13_8_21_14_all_40_8]
MTIVRPVKHSDLEQLYNLAKQAGHGLTTLPADRDRLEDKIIASIEAFSKNVDKAYNEYYLFVLEDSETGDVIGTSALDAAVGMQQPFYTYKVGTVVHSSPTLDVHNPREVLMLGNDYTGATELCTLFLSPDHRKGNNGKLLSKSRFLFIAQNMERFSDMVIAELRGYSDENGRSPFWDAIGGHFFTMSFSEADKISGMGNNQFIAELMPKYPIYISLLPHEAQNIIGKVHPDTKPALKLLKADGFRFHGYVDIFDAGPTIECDTDTIATITKSSLHQINIGSSYDPNKQKCKLYLIANTHCMDYRASTAYFPKHLDEDIHVTQQLADILHISTGDEVIVSPLF